MCIFYLIILFFRFPLFGRTKSRLEFNYAVYLLNKNIAQLRWYNGYSTNDLRTTLYNCLVLLQPQSSLYVYIFSFVIET